MTNIIEQGFGGDGDIILQGYDAPPPSSGVVPLAVCPLAPTAAYNYNDPNDPSNPDPPQTPIHWFGTAETNYPAGTYYVAYLGGDMNWGGPITDLWNGGVCITDGNGNSLTAMKGTLAEP